MGLTSQYGFSENGLAADWYGGAVIVPPYKERFSRGKLALTILDAEGGIVPGSDCRINRRTNVGFSPPPDWYQDDLETLSGRWIFCGLFQPHFGHQITQCLGRLPWISKAGPVDGVLFAGFPRGAKKAQNQTHFHEILNCMCPGVDFKVIVQPTRVEALYVGESLFDEFIRCTPRAGFTDWVRQALRPITAKAITNKKLYVSRNRLSPLNGRILCEEILEDNLRRCGFDIYYPEEHSLKEQLRAYSEAEVIITTEGSAAHVIAFTQNPDQKVVIIARRHQKPELIHNHLLGFQPATAPENLNFVDCLIGEWQSPDNHRQRVRGEIDFGMLLRELQRFGVLCADAGNHWVQPTPDQLKASSAIGNISNHRPAPARTAGACKRSEPARRSTVLLPDWFTAFCAVLLSRFYTGSDSFGLSRIFTVRKICDHGKHSCDHKTGKSG